MRSHCNYCTMYVHKSHTCVCNVYIQGDAYRVFFYSLDEFTASGALLVARRMRILPMNQHA
jgi:hypothetical protein